MSEIIVNAQTNQVTVDWQHGGIKKVSAGNTKITSGEVVFSNRNGVSFGISGNTITASVAAGGGGGGGIVPAISFENGSFTFDTLSLGNLNGLSFYSSNGSMVGSYTVPVVPAQTEYLFSNSNGVSFGTNGSTVTASHNGLTTAALSNHSHNFATTTTNGNLIVVATTNSQGATIAVPPYLTTAQPVGAYLTTARASNDAIGLNTAITQNGVSMTANSSGLSLNFPAFLTTAAQSNHSHGNPTLNLTNLSGTTASNSAGFTLSLSAAAPSAGGDGVNIIAAGTQTANTTGTVLFNNANGITFGMANSSVVTASHNGLTTARASNDAVGLNTALTAGPLAWTVNSSGISLNAASAAGTTSGFAGNLISGSMTHNTAGLNLSLNHPAWLTTAALSNHSHNLATTTTNGSLIVVATTNSNGATFAVPAFLTTAQPVGAYLTTARASNDAVGLNTAQTNVTWTVNSAGISLNAGGYAGTGTSATNASITLNSNGLAISVAAPGGGGAINVSAGTTSGNLQTIVFSDSNGVSFGLNGSTVTATIANETTLNGYVEPILDREMLAAQIGNNQLFIQPLPLRAPIQFEEIAWLNNYSNATNSSFSATLTLQVGFYTRNNSTLSLVTSASQSFAVTNSGTVGSYSIYGGLREYPIAMTTTLNRSNYFIAFLSRTTTGGGAGMTWSNFVGSQINSAYSGRWSSANNATNQFIMGLGSYSATTTALPNSIGLSQINGSAAVNARPVIFKLVSQDLN